MFHVHRPVGRLHELPCIYSWSGAEALAFAAGLGDWLWSACCGRSGNINESHIATFIDMRECCGRGTSWLVRACGRRGCG